MKHYRRCILFLADGARPDVFEDLLGRGRLPAIKEHLADKGTCSRAITVLPSTTGPAYLPFLTGRFPGPANLPGIRWFDRCAYHHKGLFSLDRFRSYVGPSSYLMNRDFRASSTLFELFDRPVNIYSALNRGIGFWSNKTKLLRSIMWLWGHYTDHWHHVDRLGKFLLRQALGEDPDFVFIVFPGMDEYGHLEYPFSENVLHSYYCLDQAVGETAAYLSQRDRLDDTLLAIVSDHGLSATHTHFDPVPFLEERGYYPLFYPKTFRRRPDTACMVSGNAMAHLYFRGPLGWNQPRTSEDFRAAGDDLIKLFASCKAISFVASRDRRGVVRVSGEAGEAHIRRQGNCIEYRVQGQDPLGYGDLPEKLSLQESLEHTFNAEFPDGPVQLLQLFQSPRCGDLVLNAGIGFDLRARYEHPEHHGSHGSLHRQHMQVPLLLNHPLEHNRPLRTVDLFPSILRLTGHSVPADLDGKSFV